MYVLLVYTPIASQALAYGPYATREDAQRAVATLRNHLNAEHGVDYYGEQYAISLLFDVIGADEYGTGLEVLRPELE